MKQITATSLLNKELIDGVRPSHLGNKELLEIITNLNLNNMPKKIISDEQFCKMCTSYYGELVDSVKQIVSHTFTGVELKEFVEHLLTNHNQFKVEASEDAIKDMAVESAKIFSVNNMYEFEHGFIHGFKAALKLINK